MEKEKQDITQIYEKMHITAKKLAEAEVRDIFYNKASEEKGHSIDKVQLSMFINENLESYNKMVDDRYTEKMNDLKKMWRLDKFSELLNLGDFKIEDK